MCYSHCMSTLKATFKLMDRFNAVGIPAHPLFPLKYYYHETTRVPSRVKSIKNDGYTVPDKPEGALWLSFGFTDEKNEEVIATDWREFMVCDMSCTEKDLSEYTTLRANFSFHSFYIVLTEENWVNLPLVWDVNGAPFKSESRRERDYTNPEAWPRVPWMKLRDLGVGAVSIDGRSERDHFYGYDVDSLVVLSGRAIDSFDVVKGKLDYDFDTYSW